MIGDNGAGKSSLIKALSGALVPDEGEIYLDGQQVHFTNPMDARAAGIETVYQTLAVAPGLDIADNLFLGREERKPGRARLGLPDARPRAHAVGGQAAHERAGHRHAAEHRPGGGVACPAASGRPSRWPGRRRSAARW